MCFRTLSWKNFENFKCPKIVVKTSCFNGATQSGKRKPSKSLILFLAKFTLLEEKSLLFQQTHAKSIRILYMKKNIFFSEKRALGKPWALSLPSLSGYSLFVETKSSRVSLAPHRGGREGVRSEGQKTEFVYFLFSPHLFSLNHYKVSGKKGTVFILRQLLEFGTFFPY